MIYFKINLEDINKLVIEAEKRDGPIIEENLSNGVDEPLKRARKAIHEFWQNIANNMRRIVIHGDRKGVLDEIINDIGVHYDKVKEEVGEKYVNLIEGIARKVSILWKKVFQMAILSLPTSLEGSNNIFVVKYYSIGINIKVGGDLKTSLNELFRFLSEGTLSVRIRYELE